MPEKQKTCLTEKEIKELYHTVLESDTENLVAEAISLTDQAIMKKAVPKSEHHDKLLELREANDALIKVDDELFELKKS